MCSSAGSSPAGIGPVKQAAQLRQHKTAKAPSRTGGGPSPARAKKAPGPQNAPRPWTEAQPAHRWLRCRPPPRRRHRLRTWTPSQQMWRCCKRVRRDPRLSGVRMAQGPAPLLRNTPCTGRERARLTQALLPNGARACHAHAWQTVPDTIGALGAGLAHGLSVQVPCNARIAVAPNLDPTRNLEEA